MHAFMAKNRRLLTPLLIDSKKIYLVRRAAADKYRQLLSSKDVLQLLSHRLPTFQFYQKQLWSYPVDILAPKPKFWREPYQ